MNKPLTAVETSSPVTKRQKLMRFANIVRSRARCSLYLFNNIEYLDRGQWKYIISCLSVRSESGKRTGMKYRDVDYHNCPRTRMTAMEMGLRGAQRTTYWRGRNESRSGVRS
jgi:hypothetical protein